MNEKFAGPDIKDLFFLVGKWNCLGEIIASEAGPSISIRGTETYAWVQKGKYLEHRVAVSMGDANVEVIELIGNGQEDSDTYPIYALENAEMNKVMDVRVNDGLLAYAGENVRANMEMSEDEKSMSAYWERTDDGIEWIPWMQLNYSKIT
jgi:hypothetical protein